MILGYHVGQWVGFVAGRCARDRTTCDSEDEVGSWALDEACCLAEAVSIQLLMYLVYDSLWY